MENFGRYAQFKLDPEMQLLLLNFMLMKLGGQITLSMLDLAQLSQDYAGFRSAFDLHDESLTLTLKTRPEEFPEPPTLKEI